MLLAESNKSTVLLSTGGRGSKNPLQLKLFQIWTHPKVQTSELTFAFTDLSEVTLVRKDASKEQKHPTCSNSANSQPGGDGPPPAEQPAGGQCLGVPDHNGQLHVGVRKSDQRT